METKTEIEIEPEMENEPEIEIEPEIEKEPEIKVEPKMEIEKEPEMEMERKTEIERQPEIEKESEMDIEPEIKAEMHEDDLSLLQEGSGEPPVEHEPIAQGFLIDFKLKNIYLKIDHDHDASSLTNRLGVSPSKMLFHPLTSLQDPKIKIMTNIL